MKVINDKPYTAKVDCPISGVEEEVFFYEVEENGSVQMLFRGCDHNWSKCLECEACQNEAYQKVLDKYR